jgi:hypothetical protein
MNNSLTQNYDSAEFTLATGNIDYDVRTQVAAFFSNIKVYRRVEIRTSENISIKLNSSSNPSITVGYSDSPYTLEIIEITNLFITNNSGATTAIKLIGTE